MRRVLFVIAAAALLAAGAAGCGKKEQEADKGKVTAGDVKREVSEALSAAGKFTVQEKDEYLRTMEGLLADYDRKIAEVKELAARETGKARKDLDKRLRRMEKKRASAARTLEKMKTAGGEAWDDIRKELDEAAGDLARLYRNSTRKQKE